MRICAGNWKMNGTAETVKRISEEMNREEFAHTEVIIGVPYTLLMEARSKFNLSYKIAAQTICAYAQKGAYTGGVSASQVKDAKAEVVIVGHSERIKYFQETNEEVEAQLGYALESGLEVILCMGETEEERKEGRTMEIISKRLSILKKVVDKTDKTLQVVVAYEPIWAIGTGKVPSNQEIEEVVSAIQKEMGEEIKGVLYGGSVTKENAKDLLKINSLSGFLVGNASLTTDFVEICKRCDGR
ncbi:triosephosphate isomerase (TIM) [Nematocida minor]|uniref:triosephosphate isomerase (TIM) n=1 Tax=Nematocida minor TaxID=1912983 RepID=UPI00221F8CF4|nr:triosephosphate isomerase (TIM) [Nematocida minor]KAI5189920.1 triosephosphate isomerase (TIM) [Nematocida minor]